MKIRYAREMGCRVAMLLVVASCASSPQPKPAAPQPATSATAFAGMPAKRPASLEQMPDFSYAGYRAGEAAIPTAPGPVTDVTKGVEIGGRTVKATPDDDLDDSVAINEIIEAKSGVIFLPAGRYVLSRPIFIGLGNRVLRGAGRDRTILVVERSLSDLSGCANAHATSCPYPLGTRINAGGQSAWSFKGGFIWVDGKNAPGPTSLLGRVAANAPMGGRTLELADTAPLRALLAKEPRAWVRLSLTDDGSGALLRRLYAGDVPAALVDDSGKGRLVDFPTRITAVVATTVHLERALPVEVNLDSAPELHRFAPTVQEVGIEELRMEFRGGQYAGHDFKETGRNGVFFNGVANGWISNVTFLDADSGFFGEYTSFSTLQGLVVDASAARLSTKGQGGHHGVSFQYSGDNLITGFDFRQKYVHDLTIEGQARGNVFASGKGIDLNLDHHRESPYMNLFTDLDLGAGNRPWSSSGKLQRGPHSGAYGVFWNLRSTNGAVTAFPASEKVGTVERPWGPKLIFVGALNLAADRPPPGPAVDWFIDPTKRVCPANLHAAQRARRLRLPYQGCP